MPARNPRLAATIDSQASTASSSAQLFNSASTGHDLMALFSPLPLPDNPNILRSGKLSSEKPGGDRSALYGIFGDNSELSCPGYSCCGIDIPDLHTLLDHFENFHMTIMNDDLNQCTEPIQSNKSTPEDDNKAEMDNYRIIATLAEDENPPFSTGRTYREPKLPKSTASDSHRNAVDANCDTTRHCMKSSTGVDCNMPSAQEMEAPSNAEKPSKDRNNRERIMYQYNEKQHGDVVTYRYNDKLVYVQPADDFSAAIKLAQADWSKSQAKSLLLDSYEGSGSKRNPGVNDDDNDLHRRKRLIRHRAKRKAYIEALEETVRKLEEVLIAAVSDENDGKPQATVDNPTENESYLSKIKAGCRKVFRSGKTEWMSESKPPPNSKNAQRHKFTVVVNAQKNCGNTTNVRTENSHNDSSRVDVNTGNTHNTNHGAGTFNNGISDSPTTMESVVPPFDIPLSPPQQDAPSVNGEEPQYWIIYLWSWVPCFSWDGWFSRFCGWVPQLVPQVCSRLAWP